MLDWDALIPADSAPSQLLGAGFVPEKQAHVPPLSGQQKPSDGAASSHALGAVPVVPPKNVGKGMEGEEKCKFVEQTAGDFLAGESLCDSDYRQGEPYPIHPSAVLLCIAWMKRARITRQEQMARLLDLAGDPPNEQVRVWSQACRDVGLKPWHVLSVPSSGMGKDCSFCRHLHQEVGRVPGQPENRREFRWGCRQGYLILELGRGTERILTAPPDCQSWERWFPGESTANASRHLGGA